MRTRTFSLVVLLGILVATLVPSPALAAPRRAITGTIRYTQVLYDGTTAPCWISFNIRMDADGNARGKYRWWTKPAPGVIGGLVGDVTCAAFDGTEAVFAARITRFVNWPLELGCVAYAQVWVSDGGNPGKGRDQVGFYFQGDCFPGFPADPGCDAPKPDLTNFFGPFTAEGGNLKIR